MNRMTMAIAFSVKTLPPVSYTHLTHEVLPSIRKTGAYNVGQELTDEEKMAHGLIAANAILQRQLEKKRCV